MRTDKDLKKFYRGENGNLHPERRRFLRIPDGVRVRYMVPLDFSGIKWETETENIGAGGIRIKRDKEIKKGTIVAIELELLVSKEKEEIVRTMARVVWCEKIAGEDEYSVGLEFVLHDKDVQGKIARFVNEHIENQ